MVWILLNVYVFISSVYSGWHVFNVSPHANYIILILFHTIYIQLLVDSTMWPRSGQREEVAGETLRI